MPRLLLLITASAAAACGLPFSITVAPQAKVTCAKGKNTCRCENSSFSLNSDETAVQSCDTPLGTNASCCYHLNSSNETTSCFCAEYACYEKDGTCECTSNPVPDKATRVASCAEKPGKSNCCWGTGYGCVCQPYAPSGTPFGCASGTGLVAKCPEAKEYFSSCSGKTAATCQGLTWKP